MVSPEQFSVAEQRHQQERIIAHHVKEKEVAKDTEALRVSIEQLREVMIYFNLFRGKDQSRGTRARFFTPSGHNARLVMPTSPANSKNTYLAQGKMKNNYENFI